MLAILNPLPLMAVLYLASLRTKLGSALELLRLYQHKLQVMESMPAHSVSETPHSAGVHSRHSREACSSCIPVSPAAQSGFLRSLSASDEMAPAHQHQSCQYSQTNDASSAQPNMQSTLPDCQAWALDTCTQPRLRFDSSVGQAGAFVHASQPANVAQPVDHQCQDRQAQSTQKCSTAGRPSETAESQSENSHLCKQGREQAPADGKHQEDISDDPWAFMRLSQQQCPVHAMRRYQGDLLSLVTDIDDMMSCSGRSITTTFSH